jgi:uncharacterized membrane protein YccC
MEKTLKKGDIVVDSAGDVALISRVDVQSDEADNLGRIHIYHVGTVLRSTSTSVGSRWAGQNVRVVCHASDLLKLAQQAGYDLLTPSETPESELSAVELLQRQVKQLQEALKQNTPPQSTPELVARPRVGIEALHSQQ